MDASAFGSLRDLDARPAAPRTVSAVLEREPTSPALARARVREVLEGRLDDADIATVLLLTSELVTNAVIHSTAPPDSTIGLQISVRANGVRVEVEDRGDGFDLPAPAVATGRGGRGLFLVDRCADSWGARRIDAERGEHFCVWFEFASEQLEPAGARESAGPAPA